MKTLIGVALLSSIVFLSSCSLFRSSAKEDVVVSDEESFRQIVSPLANPTTTPVEVATEFYNLNDQRRVFAVGSEAEALEVPKKKVKKAKFVASNVEEDDADTESADAVDPETEGPVATVQNEPALQVKKTASEKKRAHVSEGRSLKKRDGSYTVAPGDTLMKISFEQYGNIFRWREILKANHLSDMRQLHIGQVLKIQGQTYVVIERNGHPYLIRKNETLAKISNTVYGDTRFWKRIWKNNPQLITDPNKIYAGFTLYYQDLNGKKSQPAPLDLRVPSSEPNPKPPAE